jgi:ABC-type Na+ transport system ATPase subunit NatA
LIVPNLHLARHKRRDKQLKTVSEALLHSPSIIIFDDLDTVISVSSDPQVTQSSNSNSLVRYLADIMDEYKVRRCYQITLNFMNTK